MRLDEFQGVNAAYVLELYERFRQDPLSVDPATRRAFETWSPPTPGPAGGIDARCRSGGRRRAGQPWQRRQQAQCHGHRHDRRRREPRRVDPALRPPRGPHRSARLGADRRPVALARGARHHRRRSRAAAGLARGRPGRRVGANAFEAIERLRRVYCSTTGFDYAHVFVPEERDWLRHAAESGRFLPPVDAASAAACSIGSPRSRPSSASCTARFPARRASRSRAST